MPAVTSHTFRPSLGNSIHFYESLRRAQLASFADFAHAVRCCALNHARAIPASMESSIPDRMHGVETTSRHEVDSGEEFVPVSWRSREVLQLPMRKRKNRASRDSIAIGACTRAGQDAATEAEGLHVATAHKHYRAEPLDTGKLVGE